MLLEFRISPTRSPLGKQRAGGIETLDCPRPEGLPASLIAYYEGPWEQVMSLIGDCREAMRDEPPRGLTLIAFDHVDDLTHVPKQHLCHIAPQNAYVRQKAAIHSGPVRHLAVSQLR